MLHSSSAESYAYVPSLQALSTERLLLRRWLRRDAEPFVRMNLNPAVMAYFPTPLTPIQSLAAMDRYEQDFHELGYGCFVLELRDTSAFVGVVGLEPYVPRIRHLAHRDKPMVAIHWQLLPEYWGQGLAYEAASAVLIDASDRLQLPEVVAQIPTANRRSVRLCERLGLQRDVRGAVEDPAWPIRHALRQQWLYRKLLGAK